MNRRSFIKEILLLSAAPGILRAQVPQMNVAAASQQIGAGNTQWLTAITPGTTRNDGNFVVGCLFTVGGSPLTVKSLSRWVVSTNSQTHTVGIWATPLGTPSLVTSAAVNTSGAAVGWKEVAITPVELSASTQYALLSEEFSGADLWHSDANTGISVTGVATLNSSAYVLAPLPVEFALTANTAGNVFVPVSFGY